MAELDRDFSGELERLLAESDMAPRLGDIGALARDLANRRKAAHKQKLEALLNKQSGEMMLAVASGNKAELLELGRKHIDERVALQAALAAEDAAEVRRIVAEAAAKADPATPAGSAFDANAHAEELMADAEAMAKKLSTDGAISQAEQKRLLREALDNKRKQAQRKAKEGLEADKALQLDAYDQKLQDELAAEKAQLESQGLDEASLLRALAETERQQADARRQEQERLDAETEAQSRLVDEKLRSNADDIMNKLLGEHDADQRDTAGESAAFFDKVTIMVIFTFLFNTY